MYNLTQVLLSAVYIKATEKAEDIKRPKIVTEDGQLKLKDETKKYISLDELEKIVGNSIDLTYARGSASKALSLMENDCYSIAKELVELFDKKNFIDINKLNYKKWYAGHFHTEKKVNDKFQFLFKNVLKFE